MHETGWQEVKQKAIASAKKLVEEWKEEERQEELGLFTSSSEVSPSGAALET